MKSDIEPTSDQDLADFDFACGQSGFFIDSMEYLSLRERIRRAEASREKMAARFLKIELENEALRDQIYESWGDDN